MALHKEHGSSAAWRCLQGFELPWEALHEQLGKNASNTNLYMQNLYCHTYIVANVHKEYDAALSKQGLKTHNPVGSFTWRMALLFLGLTVCFWDGQPRNGPLLEAKAAGYPPIARVPLGSNSLKVWSAETKTIQVLSPDCGGKGSRGNKPTYLNRRMGGLYESFTQPSSTEHLCARCCVSSGGSVMSKA